MPSSSGTFNFQSVEIELLIRKAFERIGILGEFVEPQKLQSAKLNINLLMLEWMNTNTNIWTLYNTYLPLNTGQAQYALPSIVSDIVQSNIRVSTRQNSGGTAQSNTGDTYDGLGGGDAANAFDGNSATACTQDVQDGNISYDYGYAAGITQTIGFVGIQSNASTTYTLLVEISQDTVNWTTLLVIPPQVFSTGVTAWFDVIIPMPASVYRIRETGGATLDIQEIYFNNNVYDYMLSNQSKFEYYRQPYKLQQGRPTMYYFYRGIDPILYIWPTPTSQYNCLSYSYKQMIQDSGDFINSLQVPSRFYPALVWGLAYHLALEYKPEMVDRLKQEYERSYVRALEEDTENVTFTINYDLGQY